MKRIYNFQTVLPHVLIGLLLIFVAYMGSAQIPESIVTSANDIGKSYTAGTRIITGLPKYFPDTVKNETLFAMDKNNNRLFTWNPKSSRWEVDKIRGNSSSTPRMEVLNSLVFDYTNTILQDSNNLKYYRWDLTNNIWNTGLNGSDTIPHTVVTKNFADNNYKYQVLPTVNALMSYAGNATTITVTDSLRGGNFNLTTLTGNAVDSGIVFPSAISGYVWKRNYSNANILNVQWFGIKNDSVFDNTALFTSLINNLKTNTPITFYFPQGYYIGTLNIGGKKVNIIGDGMTKSFLCPPPNGVALIIGSNASWDRILIKDIGFQGTNNSKTQIGVQFGNTVYQTSDEFSGRTDFVNVRFESLDKCINRPYGSISVSITNGSFSNSNYHLFGKANNVLVNAGSQNMENGLLIVKNCHFMNSIKASIYISDTAIGTPSGMFNFENNTFEANSGFVFFVDGCADVSAATPSFVINNCWFENNATGTNINVNGTVYPTPTYHYFKTTGSAKFDNCPIHSITLVNSNVNDYNCNLSLLSVIKDTFSILSHHYPSVNHNNINELTEINNYPDLAGGAATNYTISNPKNFTTNSNLVLSLDPRVIQPWTGSVGRNTIPVSGGIVSNIAQSLAINVGDVLVSPTNYLIKPGKIYYFSFTYKVSNGFNPQFSITEATTLSSNKILTSNNWKTIAGIVKSGTINNTVRVYLYPNGSNGTITIGGFQLLEFSNAQDAYEYGITNSLATFNNPTISDNIGNIGIGTITPSYQLDVNSTANPLRLQGLQAGASTDLIVTSAAGVLRTQTAAQIIANGITKTSVTSTFTVPSLGEYLIPFTLTGTTQSSIVAATYIATDVTGCSFSIPFLAGDGTGTVKVINRTASAVTFTSLKVNFAVLSY